MIRLIQDDPRSGSMNMSVDQVLLDQAAGEQVATLRFYRWLPATLSLGYFQDIDSRQTHAASVDCACVRRASGGGAIMHDHELTYSIALPSSSPWAKRNQDLFSLVHQVIIDCLQEMGVDGCRVFTQAEKDAMPDLPKPFLCFQRRSPGDVVLDGEKVIGSAQRRQKEALLQHGSILMQRSSFAPELPGICDLRPDADCSVSLLATKLPSRLGQTLELDICPQSLSKKTLESAELIRAKKFDSDSWNHKR